MWGVVFFFFDAFFFFCYGFNKAKGIELSFCSSATFKGHMCIIRHAGWRTMMDKMHFFFFYTVLIIAFGFHKYSYTLEL